MHLVCTRRGGEVTATSVGGSTFTATMPAANQAGRLVIGVLIVDDDFMVAKVHAGFVSALEGFEVVGTASSGAQALAEIDRLRPDLVLLDVYLPDMTGLEVLRRLRAGGSPVDVIVISAARDVESIRSALHGGVLHYLVKPFDRRAFETRLRDYAALRGELEELEEAAQPDVDRMFGMSRGGAAVVRADTQGHRARDAGAGAQDPGRGGGGRALGQRVQRAHRAGPGQRPAVPGAAGGPAGGRRPPAVRHRRPAGAAVHVPVARAVPAEAARRGRNDRNVR